MALQGWHQSAVNSEHGQLAAEHLALEVALRHVRDAAALGRWRSAALACPAAAPAAEAAENRHVWAIYTHVSGPSRCLLGDVRDRR